MSTRTLQQIIRSATPLGNSQLYGAGLVNATAAVGDGVQGSVSATVAEVNAAHDQDTENDGMPFSRGRGAGEATA